MADELGVARVAEQRVVAGFPRALDRVGVEVDAQHARCPAARSSSAIASP
ncbi:MAG: hypothetical protein U5L06_06215 [Rhodovibrio sp.]|nr:hypothetical protein [Rhodovibrio sp.]